MFMRKKRDKKGQITIFIILAIVIVAIGVLIYMFYPQIRSSLGFETQNPNIFIQNCLQDKIQETISIIGPQGGSLDPEFYYTYQDDEIEYLCYTNEDYQLCTVQQPMLKQHIEAEIKKDIEDDAEECFDELESTFRGRGYQVSLNRGDFAVELLPKRVVTLFNSTLSLKKGEDTQVYKQFNIAVNNNIYELVTIATSIISLETTLGDSEVEYFMQYYRDLKVQKIKQSEGTTVYILTDLNTGDIFQFASRSLAWPPGI